MKLDGNKNVKKRYRLKKCGARIVAHFLVLLFAVFANDYEVKLSSSQFYREREQTTANFSLVHLHLFERRRQSRLSKSMKLNQSRLCVSKHELSMFIITKEKVDTLCMRFPNKLAQHSRSKEMQQCCELRLLVLPTHVLSSPKSEKRCYNCLNVHDFLPNQ